jgi:hypothetical protein
VGKWVSVVDALVLVFIGREAERDDGVKDGVSETETRGSSRAFGGRGDEGETPEREREREVKGWMGGGGEGGETGVREGGSECVEGVLCV